MHVQEVFELYGAMAMLERAAGNREQAASPIATLEGMVQDETDSRRLAQARQRVVRGAAVAPARR